MLKLQIIVTHYNEPVAMVKRFLDSVDMQQFINFSDIEVLIINDGTTNEIKYNMFGKYNFNLRIFTKDWSGLSLTREFGMSFCSAKYIMFCDCDDLFASIKAVYDILHEIKNNPDLIVSTVAIINNNSRSILNAKQSINVPMIHGKIYKYSIIKDNNIHWNKNIVTWNEDKYFNTIYRSYITNVSYIEAPTYIWLKRENSVSSVDEKEFLYREVESMFIEPDLVRQQRRTGNVATAKLRLVNFLFYCYTLYFNNLIPDRKLYLVKIARLGYLENIDFFDDENFIVDTLAVNGCISQELLSKSLSYKITFLQWLKEEVINA